MYFKKIVNFAKDAIRTIAPALSSQNKFQASTAGLVNLGPDAKPPPTNFHGPRRHKTQTNLGTSMGRIGNRVRNPGRQRG